MWFQRATKSVSVRYSLGWWLKKNSLILCSLLFLRLFEVVRSSLAAFLIASSLCFFFIKRKAQRQMIISGGVVAWFAKTQLHQFLLVVKVIGIKKEHKTYKKQV